MKEEVVEAVQGEKKKKKKKRSEGGEEVREESPKKKKIKLVEEVVEGAEVSHFTD